MSSEEKNGGKKQGFMGDAMKLFLITLIAGVCLGAAYEVTKAPIALAQVANEQKQYKGVFEEAASFEENTAENDKIESSAAEISKTYSNAKIEKVMEAKDSSGQVIGHVVNAAGKGFGGDVEITIGIRNDGTVNGIGFLSISESAGLGMNAEKKDFYGQYAGKKVKQFTVVKKGTGTGADGEINAISGATITSRAVTNAVNAAVYFTENCIEK